MADVFRNKLIFTENQPKIIYSFSFNVQDKSYVGQQQINLANTVHGNEVYLGCHEDSSDRHMSYQVCILCTDKKNSKFHTNILA